MIVRTNVPAINAHRNLLINNNAIARNLERLSSGFRINRAADDAAGLAISERMRGQIRGLAMAEQNTSHAINLIQTAEGALDETHAILQRMRELAVQASNGTYGPSDRALIDLEFQALMSEIDRIAESTHYNGINLLDGSIGGGAARGVAGGVSYRSITQMTTSVSGIAGSAQGPAANTFVPNRGQAGVWVSEALDADIDITASGSEQATVRDVYVTFLDHSGNERTVSVRVDNLLTGVPADGDMTNVFADWTDVKDVLEAIADALMDTELARYFDVDVATGDDALSFTAARSGVAGAAQIMELTIVNTLDSVSVQQGGTSYRAMRAVIETSANANYPNAVRNNVAADIDHGDWQAAQAAFMHIDIEAQLLAQINNPQGNSFTINGQSFRLTFDNTLETGSRNADGTINLFAEHTNPTSTAPPADISEITDRSGRAMASAIESALGLRVTWKNADTDPDANGIGGDGSTAPPAGLVVWAAPSAGGGVVQGQELTFQIGANGGADQRVSLAVNAMDTRNIGESNLNVGFGSVTGRTLASASILTLEDANQAIDIIGGAIDMVSAQRAQLGALQNRLESTMNSLGIAKENLTAAESTIRDVDMAAEMMKFTQNSILAQAAQAMLAQANQLPQGVLMMLR